MARPASDPSAETDRQGGGDRLPDYDVPRIPDDEEDNRILECAVAGHADLIVTSDRHLRRLKTFRGIGIVLPIDFRRTFE
jgi:predicted nucleic acid-binding protein